MPDSLDQTLKQAALSGTALSPPTLPDEDRPRPSFFELRHLGFVNWYAFFKDDIQVRGRIALLGHNGAGKSVILDAIQTVLTGNDRTRLRLNASVQNEEIARSVKSKRTVRDYCLGAIDDADLEGSGEGAMLLRDQAVTYLLLGFERTDTHRQVTVGLCLEAHKDRERENPKALFIVEGRILTTDDVADEVVAEDGGRWSKAKPWEEVRAAIEADPALDLLIANGPELFVTEICHILGPEFGKMDKSKFLKNLRNALTFKAVTSSTEFVRNYILDPYPVSVAEMRASIARYTEIEKKVDELKRRLESVKALSERAREIRAQRALLARRRLGALQGRLHQVMTDRESNRRKQTEAQDTLVDVIEALRRLEATRADLTQRLADLRQARDTSASAQALAALDLEIRGIDLSRREVMTGEALTAACRLVDALRQALPIIKAIAPDALTDFLDLVTRTEGSANLKVEEKAVLAVALTDSGLADVAGRVLRLVEQRATTVQSRMTAIEADIAAIDENIRRVSAGKSLLNRRTTIPLLQALQRAGIDASPLCERVTGVDEEWRLAAEAVLGDRREALLVAPEIYETALSVYRRTDIDGASIVNTTKTPDTRPAKRGSLATVVDTDDRHARAFLDYLLGGLMMVRTEAELRREDSAITVDLMHAAARTVRKLRAPSPLLLGCVDTQGALEQLRAERQEAEASLRILSDERANLIASQRALRACEDQANRLVPVDLTRDISNLSTLTERFVTANLERARIAEEQDRGITQAILAAERDLKTVETEAATKNVSKGRLETTLGNLEEALASNEEAIRSIQEKSDDALLYAARVISQEHADEQRSLMFADTDPGQPDFTRIIQPADREAIAFPIDDPRWLNAILAHLENFVLVQTFKRVSGTEDALFGTVREYLNTFDLPPPDCVPAASSESVTDDDTRSAAERDEERFVMADAVSAWIASEEEDLRDNELVRKEAEAAEARNATIRTFKEDFVGKVRGAFDAIEGVLEDLNRQLRKRDFHGLTYRFSKRDAAGYRDMITLINRSSDPEFDLPLFEQASGVDGALDEATSNALKRLQALALDPHADIGDIEDPRRYFEFHLEMLNRKGDVKTDLARRIGTGSGGQLQVPFYVSIGAALAATCYPDRKGLDGGLAMAVFDEAFSKMDAAVVSEVLQFNESVGLQTIIAAPDKERSTFEQFMDTIVTISRMGTAIMIDVQEIKPHAHAEFRKANPRLIGFDGFRAAALQEGQAAGDTASGSVGPTS